jgi:hypothetical protein
MARELRSKKGTTKSPQSPQSPKRKRKAKATAETKSVDINDEDYNIRSSESTQLLTQAGVTTKSPEGRRMAKAAAVPKAKPVDVNDEDYNIRSPERTQLLTKLREYSMMLPSWLLSGLAVSSPIWTACKNSPHLIGR